MKIVKYIILILVIFVISLFVLSRVPAIQDRVVTNVIKNVLSNPVSLPDDGLSALVCGSRSPLPSPGRAETCIIIKAGQNLYVVDIGDGSINNLRNWRIDLTPVKAVLFTHLHSDHISDLADLHLNTWVNNPTKTEKLKVYGPEGVEDVVNGFEWTHTPGHARQEVPYIRLSEYRVEFNSLVQNIRYLLSVAKDGVGKASAAASAGFDALKGTKRQTDDQLWEQARKQTGLQTVQEAKDDDVAKKIFEQKKKKNQSFIKGTIAKASLGETGDEVMKEMGKLADHATLKVPEDMPPYLKPY